MVEHAVEDDLHPAAVNLLHEMGKILVGRPQVLRIRDAVDEALRVHVVHIAFLQELSPVADDFGQMRINVVVVLDIVFMIGRGDKDRVEVDHFHAQLLQIIQLLLDAFEVASPEIPDIHVFGHTVPVADLAGMPVQVSVLIRQHVIGAVAVAETVRIDLIHHGAPRPFRRPEARENAERMSLRQIPRNAQLIVIAGQGTDLDLKIVVHRLRPDRNRKLVVIKASARLRKMQMAPGRTADKVHVVHIVAGSTNPDGHIVARHRLKRFAVEASLITENRAFFKQRAHQRYVLLHSCFIL